MPRLNTNDMSIKFIIITILESMLVIFLIIGFIREKKLIKYERQISYRLGRLVNQFRDAIVYLCGKHK